jgi:Fic family protein
MHPLLKAVALHFMLAYEHPFVDGNGRVARALFYWYALKQGYWLLEYVSISSVIAEAKIDYGRSFLFVESDDADLTYFLCNQTAVLKTALQRLHHYVERKKQEVQALEERLSDRSRPDALNHRQSWVLNEFVRGRINRITIAEHVQRHSVSYLTARTDLERLVGAGFLRKTKSAQTSLYRPVNNLVEKLMETSG